MKITVRSKKAQAMTEFIMVMPVFICLLVAMYQFTLFGITRIELAMFEREIMRYLTSDGEDAEKINNFKDEYAQKAGLDPSKLRVSLKEEKPENGVNSGGSGMNFLNKITGSTFCVEYDQPLIPAAAKITGRQSITIRTRLFTATGGSFKLNMEKAAKDWFAKLGGKSAPEESGAE